MANDLAVLLPKILAGTLSRLRGLCVMPSLINLDYDKEAKEKGDTIDVPIAAAQTAGDITPAAVPPTPSDKTPTKVQISLNKWKGTNFHLTDKQLTEIDEGRFLGAQFESAAIALAEQINSDIYATYKGVYGYVGTAGTTPFASTVADATNARKTLTNQRAPSAMRRAVLNPDGMANALNLAPFASFQQSGDPNVVREGSLGRKYGFDWYEDQQVTSHTKAAAGTILVDQADVEIGDTTVHFDGITTLPAVGDVFTVAGDTQTYVVTSTSVLSTADADFTFDPPAKVAWADDAAVTFKNTHVVNLAFCREAFAMATRPLVEVASKYTADPSKMFWMQDPFTKMFFRVEFIRQYKQTMFEVDTLYGVKLVRAELATRIAG